MTAPVGSCMTPLMLACVWATAGRTLRKTINQIDQIHRLGIVPPFWGGDFAQQSSKAFCRMRTILRAGKGGTPDSSIQKSGVHFISELQLQRELDLPRCRG